jgi:hypothetical protein
MVELDVRSRSLSASTGWVRICDVVAFFLALGIVTYGIGDAINGVSGEFGSGWYLGSAFNYVDALFATLAVVLVLWLRVGRDPVPFVTSSAARLVLVFALVIALLVVISACIYAVEGFADHSLTYDAGEKVGKVITAIADIVVASAAATFAVAGFSFLRASEVAAGTPDA